MASALNPTLVRTIFEGLATGDSKSFMGYLAEDVKWTATNPDPLSKSHPLAGFYDSRQAIQDSLVNLSTVLEEPLRLIIDQEPIVSGEWAVVELKARTPNGEVPYGKNGTRFDNRYAWIFRWDSSQSKIVVVRAYLDSAIVANIFKV